MTAFELSEKKVRFIRIWDTFFTKEANNNQYILAPEEYNILLNKIQEGVEIIDEYLKEKG